MEQKTLLRLRIAVPGLLLVALTSPLWIPAMSAPIAVQIIGVFGVAIAGGLGAIYGQLRLRDRVIVPYWRPINRTITNTLIDIAIHDPEVKAHEDELRSGNAVLKHAFYPIVDHDETLGAIGRRVYLNGLYVSSAVDLHICALFAAFAYLASYLLFHNRLHAVYMGWLILMSYFALYEWLPRTIARHSALSQDQLDHIRIHKSGDVVDDLTKIIVSAVS